LDYSLVSIGLVSFVVIAQLAPAFLALYSGKEDLKGAVTGIILGFVVCFYTLLLPYALGITSSSNTFIQEGPWSLEV
jgi:Na+/proline symporter